VPHFSRKQVIKQLERITQGTEVSQGSGKHPKFIANGKQVPVPNHTGDFPRGTLRAILRELGINMSVRQFMAGGRLG
jgi:predicted RNA binding protein YcfA (HicA-like mRNA interferase family)